MMRRRVLLLNVLALVLVAGCSQEPKDWQTAAETDSEAGYEAYLAEHPDGEHAGDASDRLHVIRGNRAWQELAGDRNVEALQVFVDSYPDHEAIDEARFLLDIHKRAEEWGAEEMRVMGAVIVAAQDGGIGLEFDEPLENPYLDMISTSVGLSSTENLVFDPADLVVGNHVQLYMVYIENELPRMTIKVWTPVGFASD